MDRPASAAPAGDPWAVAIGNASLLGIGYLMAGRRATAVVSGFGTALLVTFLACAARSVWAEVLVLLWWAAVIAHGWFLGARHGGPRTGARVRRQRMIALAVTIPVLAAVVVLRVDAARVGTQVARARDAGDCVAAAAGADRMWAGHRVADAPSTAAVDRTVRACALLRRATTTLDTALSGDISALATGFDTMSSVIALYPGHDAMVRRVLDGFLGRLPTGNACHTVTITDWLAQRPPTGTPLDRATEVAVRIAPAARIACQLDTLRTSLRTTDPNGQPAYCSRPQPYAGARPYGPPGPDLALLFGNGTDTQQFPAEWRARDAADAVLILCAGPTEYGDPVETCPYVTETSHRTGDVTFHKRAIPVRAYEVRTGRLITDARIQIGGASCPDTLHYRSFADLGPPPRFYVSSSDGDVRAAFDPLINPR